MRIDDAGDLALLRRWNGVSGGAIMLVRDCGFIQSLRKMNEAETVVLVCFMLLKCGRVACSSCEK